MNYQLSTFIRVCRTSGTQHFACQNAGLLLVGFVQRRDGRRKPTILSAGYSAKGSSHSACTDLESNLSCPFNYVRLAVHRNPHNNLRPSLTCKFASLEKRRAVEASRRVG